MLIAFRTDASLQIGAGHVMRCLTLAAKLREQGAVTLFICREHIGHYRDQIIQGGHGIVMLPPPVSDRRSIDFGARTAHASWLGTDWKFDAQDTCKAVDGKIVDWLVVDHYALDIRWEKAVLHVCKRLMVIDDLADRPHVCDLLLDQNLGRITGDYSGLVPKPSNKLIGPKYALLRPEFAKLRGESLSRRTVPQVKRLLVAMGGVDNDNITTLILDSLSECTLPIDLTITVVLGSRAPWLAQVEKKALTMQWTTTLAVDVKDMAQLFADSDLAIGAAGGTAWERCCMGLPSLVMVLAKNQEQGAEALLSIGASYPVHNASSIASFFSSDLNSSQFQDLMARMTRCSALVADGQGACRVAREMLEYNE